MPELLQNFRHFLSRIVAQSSLRILARRPARFYKTRHFGFELFQIVRAVKKLGDLTLEGAQQRSTVPLIGYRAIISRLQPRERRHVRQIADFGHQFRCLPMEADDAGYVHRQKAGREAS